MLNGASDSTPGDRAFAGAAFVVARREGMAVDRDILGGRLKIDEVSTTLFDAMGDRAQAMYSPEADGQLKGDTLYLPATFDMENLADLGVLVHELQHASDDAAVDRPTSRSRLEVESAAYERQSRFLMLELEKLTGDARAKAAAEVGSRIGQTHVYFMIAVALEATDDDQFDDRARIVAEVNKHKDPGTELEPAELRRALNDTKEGNRTKARAGIVDDIKRYKRPKNVVFRGFNGRERARRHLGPSRKAATRPQGIETELVRAGHPDRPDRVQRRPRQREQRHHARTSHRRAETREQRPDQARRRSTAAAQDRARRPDDQRRRAPVPGRPARRRECQARRRGRSEVGPRAPVSSSASCSTTRRRSASMPWNNSADRRPAKARPRPRSRRSQAVEKRTQRRSSSSQRTERSKRPTCSTAMQTAASDFTVGDMVAAGAAYAVAAAAASPEGRRSEGRTDQGRRDAAYTNRGGSLHPDSQRRGREGRHDVFQVDV